MTVKEGIMKPPIEPPVDESFIIDPSEEDDLIDRLIETNPKFREMLAKSKASPREPFVPEFDKP
jgi:hypothetical protein